MSIKSKASVAALIASISLGAQAGNFNYNYVQADYFSGDFDGFGVTGSFVINPDMFIIANYTGVTNDDLGIDLDYNQVSIGGGFHMPVDTKTDAVFTVSFVSGEFDDIVTPFGTIPGIDDTGVLLTAGVRHNLNANIELAGGIFHTTVFDGDTGIQGEARYNINQDMSAGLTYTSSDIIDGIGLNFRMGF